MKIRVLVYVLAFAVLTVCAACLMVPVRDVSASYVPAFSVIKLDSGRYWICDRGEKVAIVGPTGAGGADACIALIRQYPGHQVAEALLAEPGVIGFAQNAGLRLHTSWITNKTFDGIRPDVRVEDTPQGSTFHFRWDKPATKEWGTVDIAIGCDMQSGEGVTRADAASAVRPYGRYTATVAFDLSVNERPGGEFADAYTYGLGDARPEVSRYDRLLWTAPDGSLNLHWLGFPCGQPMPKPPITPQETFYEHHGGCVGPFFTVKPPAIIMPKGGLMAFADEPQGNPAVMVEDASPPVRIDVCYTWFDVHFVWHEPLRVKERTFAAELDGPPFRYRARLRAWWLNPADARRMLASARQLPLDQTWFDRFIPIRMNAENDFEWRIDAAAREPAIKQIYLWMNPDGGVSYDSSVARSGKHSVLFDGDKNPNIDYRSTGPELLVTPGKRVKLGAWVKTENLTGEGFRLESSFFLSKTPAERGLSGPFTSRTLTGTNDWTWLEVPMPVTPHDALWLPRRISFILKGSGKAWVDDLVFAEE